MLSVTGMMNEVGYDTETMRRATAATTRLAVLMASGEGKSTKALDLREELATLEEGMDRASTQFLRGLSSDLYSLEDDEIYDAPDARFPDARTLKQAIYCAYQAKHWDALLVLLRQHTPLFPQAMRAYLRGRAYSGRGQQLAATELYLLAARHNGGTAAYLCLAEAGAALDDPAAAAARAASLAEQMNPEVERVLLPCSLRRRRPG